MEAQLLKSLLFNRMKIFIFLSLSLFTILPVAAANYALRLVIRDGNLVLVDNSSIPYSTFSSSAVFQSKSDLLIYEQGDVLDLNVVNFSAKVHAFQIDGMTSSPSINPGDSVALSLNLNISGIFRYYDPLNDPFNAYIGLSGILHVKEVGDVTPYFYWDLREHETQWNSDIISGSNPILTTYSPKYFTINGNSEPDIENDPLARITGTVGNELRIIVLNNGLSIHSMHFHGYHGTILSSSKNTTHVGRSKDTFPIYPNEHLVISIIPDKTGEYPIHDHNLVAVNGGGVYHAGMLTSILVGP